jgi:hypothetical protein
MYTISSVGDAVIQDDDPYIARRGPFLAAALPPDDPGVEFTFDMFLEDFFYVYEDRIWDKVSLKDRYILRQAALKEYKACYRDYEEFSKLMDFLFEQIPHEDNAAASELIWEAYTSLYDRRRNRYNQTLDSLSTTARDLLQKEYFDKLVIYVGPDPQNPRHYRFSLAINFPNEKTRRIERIWTYILARGMPVKQAEKRRFEGCGISMSSGGPSGWV